MSANFNHKDSGDLRRRLNIRKTKERQKKKNRAAAKENKDRADAKKKKKNLPNTRSIRSNKNKEAANDMKLRIKGAKETPDLTAIGQREYEKLWHAIGVDNNLMLYERACDSKCSCGSYLQNLP